MISRVVSRTDGLASLLRDPAYLRVWSVGAFSGIARWLELLVVGVFAIEVTGSPFLVALLLIVRMLPLAVFGSFVGTVADRLPQRLCLSVGLALAAAVSITVALLRALGLAQYWHVALATFASGMVWTLDIPLRRRLLGDIAGTGRIAAAMSFDSATNNGTRMIGPLVGGILYGGLGASNAFALAASLYAVAAAAILIVPVTATAAAAPARTTAMLADFRETFRFIANDGDVLRILLVTIVFNIWGFPFVSMIPVIGSAELGLSPGWIGGLAAMEGAGAFVGALAIAVVAPAVGFRRIYYCGALGLLILVFIAGWMTDGLVLAAFIFTIGLVGAGFYTMQSTLIYSVAPPKMRGRLFGVLVICIGTGLIGFTNVGLMGEWFGGSAAIRIIAAEGLIPLVIVGIGWRRLWRLRAGARPPLRPRVLEQP